MPYVPLNLVSKHTKRVVRVWFRREGEELKAYRWHQNQGGRYQAYLYKVYNPNNTDSRTGMDGAWLIVCNGAVITTKTTEAAADTFIRKVKDAINTHEGNNTVKQIDDFS